MGKPKKATGGKKIKDLSPKNAKAVAGGRAGKTNTDYLVFKLSDVQITNI